MRLKSEIWAKAYLRRCAGDGAMGAVVKRGDTDAGTIFIKIARLDGTADLYGPAPSGYVDDETNDGDRRWMVLAETKPEADVDAMIERERRLDSDAWIIEIEDRQGRHFLNGWLAKG